MDYAEAMLAEEFSQLGKLGQQAKELSERLNAITVEDRGSTGLVRVVVGAAGKLQELTIDPRAMRMSSESLAEEIVGALDAATDAYQEQASALVAEMTSNLGLANLFGPRADNDFAELTEQGLHQALSESENLLAQLRSRLRR